MSDLIRHLKDLLWWRAFAAGQRAERRRIISLLKLHPARDADLLRKIQETK